MEYITETKMPTTNRDYASKEWLSDDLNDSFQIVSPDAAIFALIVVFFFGAVFGRYL